MSNLEWLDLKMTSNNAPAPYVASASTQHSANYYVWKAFDGDSDTYWLTPAGTTKGWIQIDFGATQEVEAIKLAPRIDVVNVAPKDFQLLGSQNGVDFDVILDITNETSWTIGETKEFYLSNKASFRYYRLNVTANNGNANALSISTLDFGVRVFQKKTILKSNNKTYSLKSNELTELSSSNADDFIEYGSTSIINFNNIQTNKNYILSKNESENAEGLLVQSIDRKPLSIKFE